MRFPRPKNAIASYEDIAIGQEVWEVYGILPPCVVGPFIVARAPMPFEYHPEYTPLHKDMKDLMVFDIANVDHGYTQMAFASDGNLEPGKSHNDNYYFRTAEDAEAARKFLAEQWDANPELKAEEHARREEDRLFDAEWED